MNLQNLTLPVLNSLNANLFDLGATGGLDPHATEVYQSGIQTVLEMRQRYDPNQLNTHAFNAWLNTAVRPTLGTEANFCPNYARFDRGMAMEEIIEMHRVHVDTYLGGDWQNVLAFEFGSELFKLFYGSLDTNSREMHRIFYESFQHARDHVATEGRLLAPLLLRARLFPSQVDDPAKLEREYKGISCVRINLSQLFSLVEDDEKVQSLETP